MKGKIKQNFPYALIVILTMVFSYGYSITHFALGVDDTAKELYYEEGLLVCTNRWTLFFLNTILRLDFIHWPTWIVDFLSASILVLSFVLWCFVINNILESVGITLPRVIYALAIALAISCPIISEVWVYYLHCGISMAYGLTALALMLFLRSLQLDVHYGFWKIIGSGVCLAVALGCYETMMDCFLIGALAVYMILHAFSEDRKNFLYDIRFFPWMIKGSFVLVTSLLVRAAMHKILMAVYHLDDMAKYGVNNYNSLFGDLFITPGGLGILIKKMYLRYFVNGVAYLPIAFLVMSWAVIGFLAAFYTIKRRNLWVIVCALVMMVVPVLSSIVAGRAKDYHSAQFVPLIIMIGFLFWGIIIYSCKACQKRIVWGVMIAVALCGITLQVKDMNKWFIQDYNKFLESRQIMGDAAEDLLENYDIEKPVVVVGAVMPSDELCQEACIPLDSWKYRIISRLTFFDPTIKEKYHVNYGGWGYFYTESPLLSVLTWARNPFENCDLVASQQYTNFWKLIGYDDFSYVPQVEMIEKAERLRKSLGMPGYPDKGYIMDAGDMLIVNLSQAERE